MQKELSLGELIKTVEDFNCDFALLFSQDENIIDIYDATEDDPSELRDMVFSGVYMLEWTVVMVRGTTVKQIGFAPEQIDLYRHIKTVTPPKVQ